ncbi:MAG: hypothetical protein AB7V06_28560 [Candidatus Obscuribacterales bacterium]
MTPKTFFAYPAQPAQLEPVISKAATLLKGRKINAVTWRELEVAGKFIANGVMNEIDKSDAVVVDITKLNFNVTFEAGYAFAKKKKVLPVINVSLTPEFKKIASLGIYDSIGYETYQNSDELAAKIESSLDQRPHDYNFEIDRSSPVYILETLHKTDSSIRILSKIKKAGIRFRQFDPQEIARLAAYDALRNVGQSVGIVVNLLSTHATDFLNNNLRAAFLLGLGFGGSKEVLALQDGDEPVPLDFRDFVSVYRQASDIDQHINEFAPKVMKGLQRSQGRENKASLSTLESLKLGSPAAENEMTTLGEYFVRTDEYQQASEGNARLVVGRKGSGKTALLLQLRDKKRENKNNIVLDLLPDGHQLKRLKEAVLEILSDAVMEHAATAFWEYSLLLELTYKLLEKDQYAYRMNIALKEKYEKLRDLYESAGRGAGEGDFSERLRDLTERISTEFKTKYGSSEVSNLSVGEVTNLIYKLDISALQSTLVEYLNQKDEVWILFDNIDKGWPTHGVGSNDIILLRALLEASRKIEKYFARKSHSVNTVVFLRNDVFELLVDHTSDRGKESRVSLDWTDPDRLRELLRKRIVNSEQFDESEKFEVVWPQISVSHVNGIESSTYIIDRSLMRPRNLLTLLGHAKSNAVNLRHEVIEVDDIEKAFKTYSADMGRDIGLELRDVYPTADELLYEFLGANEWLTFDDLKAIFKKAGIPDSEHSKVLELLVWFSFLGKVEDFDTQNSCHRYIYDVFYDMKKFKKLVGNFEDPETVFCIHEAFHPFLEIPN